MSPADRDDTRGELQRYRRSYLKLRSVLYDRTTGLPAFPVLFTDLRTWLDDRNEIGVLHFEIANLEMVESLYGWQVFDRIVARASAELRATATAELPEGTLLAVNGVAGDRFVAFVRCREDGADADGHFLARLTAAVVTRLEQAFDTDAFAGLSPRLSFRSGYALLSENPFYRFERCVYAAVEEARGAHERRERRRELSWSEELQQIIQSSAVETLFQPVVDLADGEVLGLEAFVRGPQDTMFEAPRAMFALSTRVGFSARLDRICCETALRRFAALNKPVKAFLNVLPESLEDDDWRDETLLPLLASLGLRPADLVFEVSDRLAGADTGPFVAQLENVRNGGFALALDDVGTGRTELDAIERLRPDYLKLDVSLVRNIHESLVKQEVLDTLVRLADRIDAAVIAEGVEREEELTAIRAGGARYGQGYLFALPSPPGSPQLDRAAPLPGRARDAEES